MDRDDVIGLLAHHMASGTLPQSVALPALRELAGDGSAASGTALLEALEGEESPALRQLSAHLESRLHAEALRIHRGTAAAGETAPLLGDMPVDGPLGWTEERSLREKVTSALSLLADRSFFLAAGAPRAAAEVLERMRPVAAESLVGLGVRGVRFSPDRLTEIAGPGSASDRLRELLDWEARLREDFTRNQLEAELPAGLPPGLEESLALTLLAARLASDGRGESRRALDLLCTWPTPFVAGALAEGVREGWARRRATLIFTCRFGNPALRGWDGWREWIRQRERDQLPQRRELLELADRRCGELLLLWLSQQPEPDAEIEGLLTAWYREHVPAPAAESVLERWASEVTAEEWSVLSGRGVARREPPPVPAPPPVPVAPPAPIPPSEPAVEVPVPPPPPPAPREPAAPPPPSLWSAHVQPFLAEYWYLVAGVAMVLAGASIVAYYTWDKSWLVRYTIMPALLATFTVLLAAAGSWIEKKEEGLRATAAILRGAAIGLLPVNFMAVALLAADESVAQRALAAPLLGLLYLGGFGYALRRWCAAVHPGLATRLGLALLAVNALVVVGPLPWAFGAGETVLRAFVGAGLHLGFAVVAASVISFSRQVLTREMAAEKLVPWFLGATLALTYVQVFLWVHGVLRMVPRMATYGPLVVLAGWLVLVLERHSLRLRGETEHGGESFLGFAAILLGTLMASADPYLRVAGFLLAGAVWLYQNLARRLPLHDWIALTLLALGGASVGLLPGFPTAALPALGIAVALVVRLVGGAIPVEGLRKTSGEMQMAVLLVTAVVAPLLQWRERSEPSWTAAYLSVIAALFIYRSVRDAGRESPPPRTALGWLHTGMTVVALALPYLGLVDMTGRELHGNVLIFGLGTVAVAWLIAVQAFRTPLLYGARSTVVLLYGAFAVAAMLLRIAVEPEGPAAISGLQDFMDLAGPLAIGAALVAVTYFTRSYLPAAMAVVILVVLFPGLYADLRATFPRFAWRSGMGGAASAFVMAVLCFVLRRAPFLRELGEGDLYMGRTPFPLRRHDSRLFTVPLTAAVLFLVLKVETWNLLRNAVTSGGVGLLTSLALVVTGAVWLLLAVFHHESRVAALGVHLSWFWIFVGSAFATSHFEGRHWTHPFLATGLVLSGLYLVYRRRPEPWVETLLARHTRIVLMAGSVLLSLITLSALSFGDERLRELLVFSVFLGVVLAWQGLRTGRTIFGGLLFLLLEATLLAWTTPGEGMLAERLSAASLWTTLWLLLAVQVVHILLERLPGIHEKLGALLKPALFLASLAAVFLVLGGSVDALATLRLPWTMELLILVVGVLTARAHGSGPLVLLSAWLAYLVVHWNALGETITFAEGIELVLAPWRWSLLALALAALGYAGWWLQGRGIRLAGAYAQRFFRAPSPAWLTVPAVASATLAAFYHVAAPATRDVPGELLAPYVGALALGLVIVARLRRDTGAHGLGTLTVVLVALANLHVVRFYLRDRLLAAGLSEIHLLALGLAVTLLLLSLLRLRTKDAVKAFLNRTSLVLAGGVLVLLSANYLVRPDLVEVSTLRFFASGALSLLAGLYFWRAARRPGPGEEAYTGLTEGCFHFALTMFFWCMALLVPWLRQPTTALVALSLPLLFFYGRAEVLLRRGMETGKRFRTSAAVLGFTLLGLYVFRGVFHLMLFPDVPVDTDHYHYNSLLVMLLAVVLLRLRGLGGTDWLAFYGGLALVVGSYFALTALPGLDPFDFPVPGAWCAIALGHLWTLVTSHRSPLRTAVQDLAALDFQTWRRLRRSWGRVVLVATQAAALWGIVAGTDSYDVAPLLVGAASVLVHQGVLLGSPLYHAIAGLEMVVALHADFFVPSHLTQNHVVWAVLALWTALLTAAALFEIRPRGLGVASAAFALTTLVHVLFVHHPGSAVGLWAVALGALLAALTPRAEPAASTAEEEASAAALLLVPAWLAYFGQVGEGVRGYFTERPLLAVAVAVLATGAAGRFFEAHWAASYATLRREPPRLFDQTLSWLSRAGGQVATVGLWIVFAVTAAVQFLHYGEAFEHSALFVLCALHAAAAFAWYDRGRYSPSMASYILLQLHFLLFFAAIRRQLLLQTDYWSPEYDVWASLAISLALVGTKELIDLRPPHVRIPLLGSMVLLPVAALVWVLVHGLGADVALVVIGLHSVMFTYLGRGDRESPYHLVAVAGFVAFVVLTFYSKLELRTVQAYVVPVGLGILVLVHLFQERILPEVRQRIRLVTMLSMLGSAAYYSLLDTRFPLAFHLTMILLCLASMGVGSFFRVSIYLWLGFSGLLVDLVSIVYRVLVAMERSSRMTVVGGLVLGVGVALVFGAAYYKTRQEELGAYVEGWRRRFSSWE